MKTSFILIVALMLNTSLLIAESLSFLVEGINTWIFIVFEGLLLAVYFLNKWIADLSKDFMLDIGYLDVNVGNDKKSSQ